MVNPGAFSGSRKEFLLSLKEVYAKAVHEGQAADVIADIQRRYLIRYPIEIPHNEEPSDEHLASVNDDVAVPDPEGPNPDLLTLEEYQLALAAWEDRQKLVIFRKAQIKRWFSYQFMKDMDIDPNQTGVFNPYRALLWKLTGKKINLPRRISAANTWRKENGAAVEAEVRARKEARKEKGLEDVTKDKVLTFWDEAVRDLFKKLPDDEQRMWKSTAIANHDEAMKKWKEEMTAKPATDPKSRQIAIQGLVKFMQPILDLVCEATGGKASLIWGGPEPAQGGLLQIISIHSGVTSGDVKMNFGRSERMQFRKVIVPVYGSFLQKTFTPAECRARALAEQEGFLPLADLDLDNEGASVDTVTLSDATPPPTAAVQAQVGNSSAPTPSNVEPTSVAPLQTSVPTPTTTTETPQNDLVRVPTTAGTGVQEPVDAAGEVNGEVVDDAQSPEEVDEVNPFPFDIDTGISRNPSPLPSPCPSPLATTHSLPPVHPSSLPSQKADATAMTTNADCQEVERPVNDPSVPGVTVNVETQRGLAPPLPPSNMEVDTPSNTTAFSSRPRRQVRGTTSAEGTTTTSRKGGVKRPLDDSHTSPTTSSAPKRARSTRSGVEEDPCTFEVQSDAPLWFQKAFGMLSSIDLGPEWKKAVVTWGRFEAECGYVGDVNVRTTNRPKAIKDWIQRARSPTWRPKDLNPTAFGSEMKSWWVGLQPEWRVGKDGELLTSLDGDFQELRRPGVNGLLSVAAGLLFWANTLKEPARDEKWLEVVRDFEAVLSLLVVVA